MNEYLVIAVLLLSILSITFIILYITKQNCSKNNGSSNKCITCPPNNCLTCPQTLFIGGWLNCFDCDNAWSLGNTICPGRFNTEEVSSTYKFPTFSNYKNFKNVWYTIGGYNVPIPSLDEIEQDIKAIDKVTGICYDIESNLDWDNAKTLYIQLKDKYPIHIFTPAAGDIQNPDWLDNKNQNYICPMLYSANSSYPKQFNQTNINGYLKNIGWCKNKTIITFQSYSLSNLSDENKKTYMKYFISLLKQGYAGLLGWPAQDEGPTACSDSKTLPSSPDKHQCYPEVDNDNLNQLLLEYIS